MAAPKLEKTKTPGVYKRGGRYVVRYRHGGEERKRFARTYAEARAVKQDLETDKRRGEPRSHADHGRDYGVSALQAFRVQKVGRGLAGRVGVVRIPARRGRAAGGAGRGEGGAGGRAGVSPPGAARGGGGGGSLARTG